MERFAFYEYLEADGAELFTAVLLPQKNGKFTTVIIRSPYVSHLAGDSEEEILRRYLSEQEGWLSRGYAVVYQHTRGQGKSRGYFTPYIYEREDGLSLRSWIRKQSFYCGELYLVGGSYTSSVHYTTAPFESDIKGAVLEVQDTERYRLWYRNGQMRKGHANWHFGLYKPKRGEKKSFSMKAFSELPLKGLSERVLGEISEDFEEMLEAAVPESSFWNTRNGGEESRNATDNIPFPILLTTGYNDFYIGGTFKMWRRMSDEAKARSAMLVSPYNHEDSFDPERGIEFPLGRRGERFGAYAIAWLENIRKGTSLPFEKGVITYYRAFENLWATDFDAIPTRELKIPFVSEKASFVYDPMNPSAFCDDGFLQERSAESADVLTFYTSPLEKDVFVKGEMKALLSVSSSCPDTAFYMSISIEKPEGDYRLRHDITSLCYQKGKYEKNTVVTLDFTFDEYAFLLRAGERLRIDISSADDNVYVCHTNRAGEYYLQTGADIAVNTVYPEGSELILPVE